MTGRVHEIKNTIESLNCSKASGPDLVSIEHLKYLDRSVYIHLALVFLAMFMIHDKLMHVNIIYIIKYNNKGCNISSKDNDRPISLSNVILKICKTNKYLENLIFYYM